jgi:hypothetical protein
MTAENNPLFLQLFSRWDTGWYIAIAQAWYPTLPAPAWAFSPLYPITIRILVSLELHPLFAAWLIATTAGLTCVPVFQKVAEAYLPAKRARTTTILYFLLPPVLLFSGISYSEPLFLLLSLLAWRYHLSGADLKSNLAAALSSLTRNYGVLIVIPLIYDCMRRKELKRLAFAPIPILSSVGWLLYAYARTGDLLAPLDARSRMADPTPIAIMRAVSDIMKGHLGSIMVLVHYWWVFILGIPALLFVLVLAKRALLIDRSLGLYTFISILAIFIFGFSVTSTTSFLRYFTFLFPIGLPLYTQRRWLLTIMISTFLLLNYLMWLGFLVGGYSP